MTSLNQRINAINATTVKKMSRGIEKESLRVLDNGALALSPHPITLGSALTHPHITTDYSESQLELITGVHGSVESCLAQLHQLHQVCFNGLSDEKMWVSSMPCKLPTDETIPLARYGTSNVARAKSVYRMGLGHRYGRRMQTISGIHYNWSLEGLNTPDYFAIIRNFRRQFFVLLYLFGASPAVSKCFVQGRNHGLQTLSEDTLYLPFATSLRMGKLGYQSEAQASIAASFNHLEAYAASLEKALTQDYPQYEKIGIQNLGGEYNQLATSLLQIENEYYGSIRPKRTIRSGERPLHALRERGVEYIEVRCLDLDPFIKVGIDEHTSRFVDMFLLLCHLQDSPPDSPEEIAELAQNQHLVASRGREPGLQLSKNGQAIELSTWVLEILNDCQDIAQNLDQGLDNSPYQSTLAALKELALQPDQLPSASVLASIQNSFNGSFNAFTLAQSQTTRRYFKEQSLDQTLASEFSQMAEQSLQDQKSIEKSDTIDFEQYRVIYTDPKNLQLK